MYEKKDNCCPLVVQSIHHKNHVKEGYANVPKLFYLRNALGIKDPNINVYAVNTTQNNSEVIRKISAKLTYPIKRCRHCGFAKVVKNSFRKTHIRLASLDGVRYELILWKQRYYQPKRRESYLI